MEGQVVKKKSATYTFGKGLVGYLLAVLVDESKIRDTGIHRISEQLAVLLVLHHFPLAQNRQDPVLVLVAGRQQPAKPGIRKR